MVLVVRLSKRWYVELLVHPGVIANKIGFGGLSLRYLYTSIYAKGYIVFIFPFIRTYVCLFVCSFVRDSIPFVELQSFTLQFLKWGISQQPLIRKHSYLDHRYPGGSAFIP